MKGKSYGQMVQKIKIRTHNYYFMKTKHPYLKLESTRTWQFVSKAIDDLVKNGDIEEKTRREYIIGYICKFLLKSKANRRNDII